MSRTAQSSADLWRGATAGAVGALIAVMLMVRGVLTRGLPVVALALWERALRVMPMEVFGFFIVRLKFLAKPLAFWGMLAALVAAGGVLGAVLSTWRRARHRPLATFRWGFMLIWVPLAVLTLGPASAFLRARLEAAGASAAPLTLVVWLVLVLAAYAAVVGAAIATAAVLGRSRSAAVQSAAEMSRREFMHRSVAVLAGAMAGSALAQWIRTAAPQAAALAQGLFERVRGLPPEVTPTDEFYLVSKNPPGFDPVVKADGWRLEVTGLVGQPLRLAYDQVRAFPSVERFHTLECISNELGGDLISNARWKGVPLSRVLAAAGGVDPKAVRIAFRCADGYSESIPVADALHPDTLLAYEMNGERLPDKHGFPLRLLIPGRFGMKNPKWIARIEATEQQVQGYWERAGWSDAAIVQTMSKFTTPRSGATLRVGEEVALGGVAYTGDRGIREVQVSTDNGTTWQAAEVKPPLGKHTWVLWAMVWRPLQPGTYDLRVRARDGTGAWQSGVETATLPNGATGYHRIRARVRA